MLFKKNRAEKEWGDGIRGLSMSAARYALLKLEESPPHVKNWRPQILLFNKCLIKDESKDESQLKKLETQLSEPEYQAQHDGQQDDFDERIEIEHPNAFAFASQLKAGKGLFVCASVITGNFIERKHVAKACKSVLKKTMHKYKAKGFSDTLVADSVEQGICHL